MRNNCKRLDIIISIEKLLQTGIEAHKASDLTKASEHYQAILKIAPQHAHANHNMGVLLVGMGNVPEAIPFFKNAINADPETDQFWKSLIEALLRIDDSSEAQNVLEKFNELRAQRGDSSNMEEQKLTSIKKEFFSSVDPSIEQLNALVELYNQQDFDQLVRELNICSERFPNSATLSNMRGAALLRLKKFGNAVKDFKKAIALNPQFSGAHFNLGNALYEQNRMIEAIEAFDRGLSIKGDIDIYLNKAFALQNVGRKKESQKAFSSAADTLIKLIHDTGKHTITDVISLSSNIVLKTQNRACIKRFYSTATFNYEQAFLKEHQSCSFIPEISDVDPENKLLIMPYYEKVLIRCGDDFSDEITEALTKMRSIGIMHNNISIFDKLYHSDGKIKIIDWEIGSSEEASPNAKQIYKDDCCYEAYTFLRSNTISKYEPIFIVSVEALRKLPTHSNSFIVVSYEMTSEAIKMYNRLDKLIKLRDTYDLEANEKFTISLVFRRKGSEDFNEYSPITTLNEIKMAIDDQALYANDYITKYWRYWWQQYHSSDEQNPVFQYRRAGVEYREKLIVKALENVKKETTILDIGSNAGEISELISGLGFNVVGFEPDVAVWRMAIEKELKKVEFYNSEFDLSKINQSKSHVAILLSVFHRMWAIKGPDAAKRDLRTISRNSSRIIFEGSSHLQRYGDAKPSFKSNDVVGCHEWHMKIFDELLPTWNVQFVDYVPHTSTEPLRLFYILNRHFL